MSVMGRLILQNTSSFADPDLGCGWTDRNHVEHQPIKGNHSDAFDPGQHGVTPGSTVWAYVTVGDRTLQGSPEDGLTFEPGAPGAARYRLEGSTFDVRLRFAGVIPTEHAATSGMELDS